MIGVCTDSNAQLPDSIVRRFGIEVVPLTVTIDGIDYLEGVDLDPDRFYAFLTDDEPHEIATSSPSPGQFAAAYDALVERGADSILSIHIGSSFSGTLGSARLAARQVPVPIRVFDSGSASFGIGCRVWAAARAVEAGASLEEAVRTAEAIGPLVGNVFLADGVLGPPDAAAPGGGGGVPVFSLIEGEVVEIDRAASVEDAISLMASRVDCASGRTHVAIGFGDRSVEPVAVALRDALTGDCLDLLEYRIGPTIAARIGPTTVGMFYCPD